MKIYVPFPLIGVEEFSRNYSSGKKIERRYQLTKHLLTIEFVYKLHIVYRMCLYDSSFTWRRYRICIQITNSIYMYLTNVFCTHFMIDMFATF